MNYNFVSREEFEGMIQRDELLEYAEYVNNYYGTSLKVIQEKLDAGIDVLLDIEVQGAAKVRSRCPDALFIFIIPPSFAGALPPSSRPSYRQRGSDPGTAGEGPPGGKGNFQVRLSGYQRQGFQCGV